MPNPQSTDATPEGDDTSAPRRNATANLPALDEASLAMITSMATEMAVQMTARLVEAAAAKATTTSTVRYTTMTWSDVPVMNTREGARLDGWFICFEAKMKAAHIPEEEWTGKLEECPKIPETVKAKLRGVEDPTYAALRALLLRLFAPWMRTAYHRQEICNIKGSTSEQVREQLDELWTLHDRAARDEGLPTLRPSDLVYAFINAFPPTVARALSKNVGLVADMRDPLEALTRMAPTSEAGNEMEPVAAVIEPEAPRPNKRVRATNEGGDVSTKIAALLDERDSREGRGSYGARGEANAVECGQCGRPGCDSTAGCAARGQKCYRCGRLNHFGRYCRFGTDQTSSSRYPPSSRQFNGNRTPVKPGHFRRAPHPEDRT